MYYSGKEQTWNMRDDEEAVVGQLTDLKNGKVSRKMKRKDTIDDEDERIRKNRATWSARMLLERIFQTNQYPNLQLRTELGNQLGMTPRKVQIWFQNRRTKAKSIQHEDTHQLQFLSQAVDHESINTKQQDTGNTLLMLAIAMDHPSVQHLLIKGADVNATNSLGWSALYTAVVHNFKHHVEVLLSKKYSCDVNTREVTLGQSPLHLACLKGQEFISWTLLSKGFDVDINIVDLQNRTPLHHACIQGHTEIVRQLLVRKAMVNIKSTEGITPLHAAALRGNKEIVAMLIRAGAEINVADNLGYTALAFAVREQHVAVAELLLYEGASVNSVTTDGLTCLHLACAGKDMAMVKLLVDCGAELEKKSHNGVTPIQVAKRCGKDEFMNFLSSRANWKVRNSFKMEEPAASFCTIMTFVQ